MANAPHFIIIGAMKCATSTLHTQLACQPGFFMSTPKEPNFFSDDDVYRRGADWYRFLFQDADATHICGESSTHYTKLPTHPHAVARMREALPDVKLVYVMRDPISRLISQHIHEWTENAAPKSVDAAISRLPYIVDYGDYAMQLRPYFRAYGPRSVLPVFFERVIEEPQSELERICRFLGYSGPAKWETAAHRSNVSRDRLRRSWLRDALVSNPVLTPLRRHLVPQAVRNRIKGIWQMNSLPQLSDAMRASVEERYDRSLVELGRWLGVELTCQSFAAVAKRTDACWTDETLNANWGNDDCDATSAP